MRPIELLVAAITGAYTNVAAPTEVPVTERCHPDTDGDCATAGRRRQRRRRREHDADAHTGRAAGAGGLGAIGWRYTLVVFAVEILFFSIMAGDRFLTTNNLILTAQNVAVLTVSPAGRRSC